MKQHQIWKNHIKKLSDSDVLKSLNNPSIFQTEFSKLLSNICKEKDFKNVIEVGCELGVTSLLLDQNLNKHFLDINDRAISIVQSACTKLNVTANFYIQDMFKMDFEDEKFDLLFNSGVIEHYNQNERLHLLKEYSRILQKNGLIVIAFPNHYSLPYRTAYLVRNFLKIFFKKLWLYPKEFKIYNLEKEINEANLILEKRIVLSKKSLFNWWNFFKPMKLFFKFLDKIFKYEGYLTVLLIKKNLAIKSS
ncbi:MAG: class I SAM-dependent methyltransferase [Ignavibacteriales bacterium]|nr:class I SAM-dependent methyltransferase [Ignavibacteriales bacterium]